MPRFWIAAAAEFNISAVQAEIDSRVRQPSSSDSEEEDEVHRVLGVPDEWEKMEVIRTEVVRWASIWGGVACWPDSLELMFQAACAEGRQRTIDWSLEVWSHMETGRQLLQLLENLDGELPDHPYVLRVLWREYRNAISTLVEGTTIIKTRVNMVNPGMFALKGESSEI